MGTGDVAKKEVRSEVAGVVVRVAAAGQQAAAEDETPSSRP
jgi:hypothetical protein